MVCANSCIQLIINTHEILHRGIPDINPALDHEMKHNNAENRAVDATLCSLELLQVFKNYQIPVPRKKEYSDTKNTDNDSNNVTNRRLSKRNSKTNFVDLLKRTSISSSSYNEQDDDNQQYDNLSEIELIPLKIHIGLAMGELCHIIVGLPNFQNDSSANEINSKQHSSNIKGRLEYCISGSVVKEAGDLLNAAKSGEISISANCWFIVKEKLELSFKNTGKYWNSFKIRDEPNGLIPGSVMKITDKGKKEQKAFGKDIQNGRLINQDDHGMIDAMQMMQSITTVLEKGEGNISQHGDNRQLQVASLAYIEESLSKYLLSSSTSSDESRDYNQIRSIISVFIRFSSLDVSSFSNPETVDKANKALCICLQESRKQGGCCRQFGCDDKAATILLVWGMEGYAHERGEAVHAVSAALEISKGLKPIFGKEFSIGIASGPV